MIIGEKALVLAATKALSGRIQPNIRAVSVSYGHKQVYLYYFHHELLTQQNRDDLDIISSRLKSDLPSEYRLHLIPKRLDYPTPVPPMGWWVFTRDGEPLHYWGYDLCHLKIATAKSLLGLVTPALRIVFVSLGDTQIYLTCIFHGEIDEIAREDMEEVARRVQADFPKEYTVHLDIQRIDSPDRVLDIGEPIYKRAESPPIRYLGYNDY
jgi:hypothetical protein